MNGFGTIFRVQVFGESHGPLVGVTVDGCPPGVALMEADFRTDLERRKSGGRGTTARAEADEPEIVSGVFDGRTTGSPICILFGNADARSGDYASFRDVPRPGHADFVSRIKYSGFADMRGSGHFSGRLTVGIVAAGVIAKKLLPEAVFRTGILSAGGSRDIAGAVGKAGAEGDSVGGLVEIRVAGLPAGLGEPFFDTCEGVVAHALFAVPGIRGVEFGDGFAAASMRGSEHNDPIVDQSGKTLKNGSGGVNGGITNGNELVVRAAFKPASSIAKPQETFDFAEGKMVRLAVGGRHDACIALRGAAVAEAATAIALADLRLRSLALAAPSRFFGKGD